VIRLLLAILISSAHSFAQTDEAKFSKALDDYMKSISAPDQPGYAVLVAKPNDHTIFSKGYGIADMSSKTAINTRTIFNLGSVSKTFVAYGILKLHEEGKLSIDDPVTKYFPNFRNKDLVKDIRIRHLLTHTSGLPDIRPVSRDSIFYLTANDEQNWAPLLQVEKLNFAPGERFEYSNPAFNGLALIIEKVSKQKWQEYIEKIIFRKAGMRTSVITDLEYPQIGVAHGYQKINGEWKEYDFGEYPTFCAAGNGGVWSSVEELLKYEEGIQKNMIVSKETTTLSRSIFTPSNWRGNTKPFLGYSWFIRNPGQPDHTIGHSGDQAGFRAEYWSIPEKNILIVILCNNNDELEPVMKKVWELLKSHKLL
jgi:CubicO group peptidase (beta-lactamase class C family)